MSHEHAGECCHHNEEHDEHKHSLEHVVLAMGSLCCRGACDHVEHQNAANLMSHHEEELLREQRITNKKSKKKKRMYTVELVSSTV